MAPPRGELVSYVEFPDQSCNQPHGLDQEARRRGAPPHHDRTADHAVMPASNFTESGWIVPRRRRNELKRWPALPQCLLASNASLVQVRAISERMAFKRGFGA